MTIFRGDRVCILLCVGRRKMMLLNKMRIAGAGGAPALRLQLREGVTRGGDGIIDIFFAMSDGHKARFKR